MRIDYDIPAIAPYINWDYFYFAWGMHGKSDTDKRQLRHEGELMLGRLAEHYRTHAVCELFGAYSDADDLVLTCRLWDEAGKMKRSSQEQLQDEPSVRIPFLRQQQAGSDFLCLADFIAPCGMSDDSGPVQCPSHPAQTSAVAVFATTVDLGMETDFAHDSYQQMMAQLLADRLAEATAERLHQEVRRTYWGYAPGEQLSMQQLHQERFQGIRPAVGYPSLPDTSINFVIDRLIGMSAIGIRLTEHGAMKPHASVSGLMFAHPEARYFSVGPIGEDQLADYARRRGLPAEVMRRFLIVHSA